MAPEPGGYGTVRTPVVDQFGSFLGYRNIAALLMTAVSPNKPIDVTRIIEKTSDFDQARVKTHASLASCQSSSNFRTF
jgi:hypothetical protein